MVKEIGTYIESKTDLVIGQTLFVGWRPQEFGDRGSVIIETGGDGNFYLPDRMDMTIQVISWAKDYFEARFEAYKIYDILNGGKGLTLPDLGNGQYRINVAEAIQIPANVGQDERGRWEFSTNYILRISRE